MSTVSIQMPGRFTAMRENMARALLGEVEPTQLTQIAEVPVSKIGEGVGITNAAALEVFESASDAWARWACYEQSEDPDFVQQVLSKEPADQISTLCLISRTCMAEGADGATVEPEEDAAAAGGKAPSCLPIWLLSAAKPKGSSGSGFVKFGMFHGQMSLRVLWDEGAVAIDDLDWEPASADFATLEDEETAAEWATECMESLAAARHLRVLVPFASIDTVDVGSELGGGSGAGLEADELTLTLNTTPQLLSAPFSSYTGSADNARFGPVSRDVQQEEEEEEEEEGAIRPEESLAATGRLKIKVPKGALEGGAAGPRANRDVLKRLARAIAKSKEAGGSGPASVPAAARKGPSPSPASVLDAPPAEDGSDSSGEDEEEEDDDEGGWESCSDDEESEELLAAAELEGAAAPAAAAPAAPAPAAKAEVKEAATVAEPKVEEVEKAGEGAVEDGKAGGEGKKPRALDEMLKGPGAKPLRRMMRAAENSEEDREQLQTLFEGCLSKARAEGEEDAAAEFESLLASMAPGAREAREAEEAAAAAAAEANAPRSDKALLRAEKRRAAKEKKKREAEAAGEA